MVELGEYRSEDLPGLVEAWNNCLRGGPNFVAVDEMDLRRRAVGQPAFQASGLLVARTGGRVTGFVHFGPRLNSWEVSERTARGERGGAGRDPREGQIYALVAPESERSLNDDLFAAAESRLVAAGARRILLGPSWVYGMQPFYNGMAGGYEIPGLSVTRESLVALAEARGYRRVAEYGTPELDLSGDDPLHHLADMTRELRGRACQWGLRTASRQLELRYFPRRLSVELVHGRQTVATTAYGIWPEYARQYRRRLYGLTSVQVAVGWRGRGLGKLIVIEAMEAAKRDGAEGVHLHVWRGNEAAWNLYHRALGFRPRYPWITMEKRV
jgi:hypothetical protein